MTGLVWMSKRTDSIEEVYTVGFYFGQGLPFMVEG